MIKMINGVLIFCALGYFANIVNTKITIPDDINHSDDELAGLSYMVFEWVRYQYNKNKNKFNKQFNDDWNQYISNNYPYFDISWNRQFKYVSTPWLSWYNLIELINEMNTNKNGIKNTKSDDLKKYIIQDLERWPIEAITWPMINSDRIDLIFDWTMGRNCGDQINGILCSRQSFPHDQIEEGRWNSNPFMLDTGSGNSEHDTGAFIMTYWIGKYFNFI